MNSTGDAPTGTERVRLNGWKEIAAHLGKGVRTVQRWESEYQLPVRRIGHQGGEIVFAFKDEIDRWSERSTRRGAHDDKTHAAPEPQRPAVVTTPQGSWRVTALAVVAVLLITVPFLALRWQKPATTVTSAVIEHGALIAVDAHNETLWTRPLDFEPNLHTYNRRPQTHTGFNPLFVADLDRDGSNEVIFATASIGLKGPQGLRVFNEDGSLRFTVAPTDRVTFGTQEFAAPWVFYRVFVIDSPDGTRSLWVSFIHSLYFPSLVLEVDAAGRVKSRYWSAGYVEQVAIARNRVFIGATHNDSLGASLAVFAYGEVRGSSPALADRFRCTSCGADEPSVFLVFPRSCIAEAVGGQSTTAVIRVDNSARVFVFAAEGHRLADGDFSAGVWFTIEPTFQRGSTLYADGFRSVHRDFEEAGQLDHSFADPRHALEAVTFLKWVDGAFVPPAAANQAPFLTGKR